MKKTKSYTFQIFQFHFHYRVIKSLSKHTYGLFVKHSAFQAECAGSNPACPNVFPFFPKPFLSLQTNARKFCLHVFELFRLFLKDTKIEARAKLECVSDTAVVCKQCFLFDHAPCISNIEIRQPMDMLYN